MVLSVAAVQIVERYAHLEPFLQCYDGTALQKFIAKLDHEATNAFAIAEVLVLSCELAGVHRKFSVSCTSKSSLSWISLAL